MPEMDVSDNTSQLKIGSILLPGDDIRQVTDQHNDAKQVIIGPGLRREGERILVIKPGILRFKDPGVFWIDSHLKRYVANRGDNVLGVVIAKAGDIFRVDIGTSEAASLSYLAFEAATKKNRPNVNIGDVVYSKLLVASKDMEAELVCVDSYGKKAGMGVLDGGGFMFSLPLHTVRKLLNPETVLLQTLGKTIPFEIAVGMNGRVWLRGRSVKETICLANAIETSEYMDNSEITAMCGKLSDVLTAF